MRVGFFPLLLGTLVVGVVAGGAAAYATSLNRTPAAPATASGAGTASGTAPATQESTAPGAAPRRPAAGPGSQVGSTAAFGQASNASSSQPGNAAPASSDAAQGAGRVVTGAVTRIEGNQIVLTTPQGPATVTVGDSTSVQRAVPASLSDVKAGDRLIVTTRQGPDGALAAVGVQIVGGN